MAPVLTATSPLERLITFHSETLRGVAAEDVARRVGSLQDLDGLGSLCWTQAGWRPDRHAVIRSLLERVLATWVESGEKYTQQQRADFAFAVGKVWGVTCFPHTAAAAARTHSRSISGQRVGQVAAEVISDPAVSSFYLPVAQSAATVPPPWTSLSAWRREDEPGTWPEGTPDDRHLIGRVLASIGSEIAEYEKSLLGTDPRSLEVERPAWIRALLRRLTARAASDWFGNGTTGATYSNQYNHWRQCRYDVIMPWVSADEFSLQGPTLVDGGKAKGTYGTTVALTVQMLMYEISEDRDLLLSHLRDVEEHRRYIAYLAVTPQARQRLNDPVQLLERARLDSKRPRRAIVESKVSRTDGLRTTRGALSAAQLKELSDEVRAFNDPEVRRALIRRYVDERPAAIGAVAGAEDLRLIALGDQSVGYDCVVVEDRELVREFAKQRRELWVPYRLDLRTHRYRDLGTTHNKHNRFGAGDLAVAQGERELLSFVGDGTVQIRDALESGQQLWLAGAGLKVRHLEHILTPNAELRATAVAREALRLSGLAWQSFAVLNGRFELPEVRHSDGNIATVAWEFQARLIYLRVLLAVRLAQEIGLVHGEAIRSSERSSVLTFLPPPDEWDTSTVALQHAYRELLLVPNQHARNPVEFVRVALTLAFCSGGSLPTVETTAGSILTRVDFLDSMPDSESAEIPVDVGKAVEWLANEQTDAGVISWYSRDSRLFRTLNELSRGTFSEFRSLEQRPSTPSHD